MGNESTFEPSNRNVAIMGTSLDNSDPIKRGMISSVCVIVIILFDVRSL